MGLPYAVTSNSAANLSAVIDHSNSRQHITQAARQNGWIGCSGSYT
jgi:hypothetical protein